MFGDPTAAPFWPTGNDVVWIEPGEDQDEVVDKLDEFGVKSNRWISATPGRVNRGLEPEQF